MLTLLYNQTGDKWLPFAKAVAEIIGVKPKYTGVPKCAYIIDFATITRKGNIEVDERTDEARVNWLIQKLMEKGYSLATDNAQPTTAPEQHTDHTHPSAAPVLPIEHTQGCSREEQPSANTQPTAASITLPEHTQGCNSGEIEAAPEHPDAEQISQPISDEDDNCTSEVGGAITISVSRAIFTNIGLVNLQKLLWAKGELIRQALDITTTDIEITDETVTFPWFGELDADEIRYISQFISGLCEFANTSKRITSKQRRESNPKFTMRTWLVRMGFNGAEYKDMRAYMMKRLPGDAAWRFGKPEKEEVAPGPISVTAE